MPTVYRLYGDARKWVCASGAFENKEGYTKDEAKKALKGEPIRMVVDVYDIANRTHQVGVGHGYDLVCSRVMWCHGKRAVPASDATPEEKKQMLFGQVCVGAYAGPRLQFDVAVKALLTDYAPNWQDQLNAVFGPEPYKVDIRTLNGRVFAIGKHRQQVEIKP